MLTVLGCEVHVADDGQQARAVAAQGRFDIVFMDCHMPVMDGYEATRLIREDERQRGGVRRPIVALTADTLLEDRDHCTAAGMDDFLNADQSRPAGGGHPAVDRAPYAVDDAVVRRHAAVDAARRLSAARGARAARPRPP